MPKGANHTVALSLSKGVQQEPTDSSVYAFSTCFDKLSTAVMGW